MDRTNRQEGGRPADLVRWGPVVSGVVIGLGLFALLNSLWIAIAYGGADSWMTDNLTWFVGASAALALLVAGVVAGMLAGVRGMLAGLANGVTAWGLLFVLSLTAVIPGTVNLISGIGNGFGTGTTTIGDSLGGPGGGISAETALWTGFWSMLVGLLLAALGGVLGAAMRRPVVVAPTRVRESHHRDGLDHGGHGEATAARSTAAAFSPPPVATTSANAPSERLGDRR